MKFIYLIFFMFYLVCSNLLFAAQQGKDNLYIYAEALIPSRGYLKPNEAAPTKGAPIPSFFGGGIGYNDMKFGYSTFFNGGARLTATYKYNNSKLVDFYLGASYVYGTGAFMKFAKTNVSIDRASPFFGFSVNIYNFLRPYVEYDLFADYMVFGVRLALPVTIKRKTDADILKERQEEEIQRIKNAKK